MAGLESADAFELDARLRRALRLEKLQLAQIAPLLLLVASERLFRDIGYGGWTSTRASSWVWRPARRGRCCAWSDWHWCRGPSGRRGAMGGSRGRRRRRWRHCWCWSTRAPGTRRGPCARGGSRCDGWRCTVPGCTAYRNLHKHHLEFRAVGGSDDPENCTTLCAFHHLRGIHAGVIRCRGRAPGGLHFALGLRGGRPPLMSYASGDLAVAG